MKQFLEALNGVFILASWILIPLGASLLWGWPAAILAAGLTAAYYGLRS